MKVRKLLRDNKNGHLVITILDGGNELHMDKDDKGLEEYLDRKVKMWAADGTVYTRHAQMTIVLWNEDVERERREAEHGR